MLLCLCILYTEYVQEHLLCVCVFSPTLLRLKLCFPATWKGILLIIVVVILSKITKIIDSRPFFQYKNIAPTKKDVVDVLNQYKNLTFKLEKFGKIRKYLILIAEWT